MDTDVCSQRFELPVCLGAKCMVNSETRLAMRFTRRFKRFTVLLAQALHVGASNVCRLGKRLGAPRFQRDHCIAQASKLPEVPGIMRVKFTIPYHAAQFRQTLFVS